MHFYLEMFRIFIQQLDLEEAEAMVATKPAKFKKCVLKCLRYHIAAINKLVEAGMIFWEYGNGLQYHAKEAGIRHKLVFDESYMNLPATPSSG